MEYPIYLAGKWVKTDVEVPVCSSWDSNNCGKTWLAGISELEEAISAAKTVFPELKAMPSWKKHKLLMKMAQLLQENRIKMAEIISAEASKPMKYALGEVDRAIQVFIVAAEESRRLQGEYIKIDWTPAGEGKEGLVKWFPAGIVAGISPFNFPLNLAVHKIAPALAAGCPIILKPSRSTPLSTLFMAELFDTLDWPKGSLSILPMDRESGNRLVTHPDIAVLTFTGSPEVGWKMKSDCGKKKVVLELGGNAGVIVDKDANLDTAVSKCLAGAFAYSGQVCIHAQRLYVHEDIFSEFSKRFVEKTKALKIGHPAEESTDITAMIDETNAKRVEDWVNEAVEGGAKVLCGAKREGALYYPTVLSETHKEMKVCSLEVFGPVVTLEPYSDFNMAVDWINDSRFGLQAGVFTNSIANMNHAFEHILAGGVIINDVPTFRVDHMPYGGIKDSGLGREGIKYAMMDYMEMKVLVKPF
ncbi:MAG: aldehyde dehydrogenase family protein [Bacteroidales bacterium]|nr:aldehyde dehydrogenase family protein [Bacteroidales bacterium]